jgi:lysozyme
MQLSKPGAGAILGHEAIYLEAYADPVGIWTIGGGHTAAAGGVAPRPGMIITFAKALRIFSEDMRKFEGRVSRAIKDEIVRLSYRFDSLVSFDFNTGAIVNGSVDDKLNRGDIDAGLATLREYVNGGGQRLPGLVTRRREEEAMFRHGRYPLRKILVKDRVNALGRYIDPASLPWEGTAEVPFDLDRSLPVPPLPARKTAPDFVADLFNLFKRIWRAL